MLDTLGEVVTCALAIVAVLVVPLAIARAWWPEVKRAAGNVRTLLVDAFFMSNDEEAPPRATGQVVVSIPVSGMHTDAGGMDGIPDIDAEVPRISRTLTDEEFFVFLVVQRKGAGYRLSANKIAQIVGGDRNTVLRRVKEIRGDRPEPAYREYPGELAKFAEVANGHEE